MTQHPWQVQAQRADVGSASRFLTQSFAWMFAGLLVTSGIAFFVSQSEGIIRGVADAWFVIFFALMDDEEILGWIVDGVPDAALAARGLAATPTRRAVE